MGILNNLKDKTENAVYDCCKSVFSCSSKNELEHFWI